MAGGSSIDPEVRAILHRGVVIPAHPLALNSSRKLDERRQRALTRYYCDAGAGGVAVGVHTTQFSIRDPKIGLLEPVLRLAIHTVRESERRLGRRLLKIAGVCGQTVQASGEARLARDLGYDAGLLSLGALGEASESALIDHCRAVAETIPLFGFYLQPTVGGRPLDYRFWRRFLEIENVVAIKVAPFNRYQTLDVVRALAASGRQGEISLYTGNDDSIVGDLMSDFPAAALSAERVIRFAGGLLGHWAVWTRRAVELLEAVERCRANDGEGALDLLAQAAEITDANAALFDPAHNFAGCIPGLHEILRRQGFLEGRWCLDPNEDLSPGQLEEIDRVCHAYPHLTDDSFVAEHLSGWLS
jgi:dihydrodipicolinate synthase/N-acetylneuraminate lyase